MKQIMVLLLLAAFTSCEKENLPNEIEYEKIINGTASRTDPDNQTLETEKKTSHGDCRTHIEASYSHGYYVVSITNYTSDCSTYRIDFPDGYTRRQTRQIQSGETLNYHYTAPFVHGAIIVTPNNQAPALCAFGSVQVNL